MRRQVIFWVALLNVLLFAATAMAQDPEKDPCENMGDYDYIQNDLLALCEDEVPALTTGEILPTEWLASRLSNRTGAPFLATGVHFLIAAIPPDDEINQLICSSLNLGEQATRIGFELRVWRAPNADVPMDPGACANEVDGCGELLFAFPTGDDEAEATVNAVNVVDLELSLPPGGSVMVGIRFTRPTNPCIGMLMQDQSHDVFTGPNNFLFGSIVCPPGYAELGLCGDCTDANVAWRDFNGDCTDVPPGVGGAGDFAIRLAYDRTLGGPGPMPDAGMMDDTSDDVPMMDMGVGEDATVEEDTGSVEPDVPEEVEFAISRVSPSMAPSNSDTEININGAGFAAGMSVRIGPTELIGLDVVDATLATGSLPQGLPEGIYDVFASLNGQSSTLSNGFIVTEAMFPAPTVTDIDPFSIFEGSTETITIIGTGFISGAKVTFSGRSGLGPNVLSDTQISVRVPSSLEVGEHDVTVENPDGQSDTLFAGLVVDTVTGGAPGGGGCATVQSLPGDSRGVQLMFLLMALGCCVVALRRRG